MTNYLGEWPIDWTRIPQFKNFTEKDWCLLYIKEYGGIDGSHHKDWVLDQVARILNGAEVKVSVAQWDDGTIEFRYHVGDSEEYHEWVKEYQSGEDGPETYEYSEGVAP